VMQQLYRSGSQPLSVALQSHVPITPYNPLLVSVCSHAARWENLRLRFDNTTFRDLQDLLSPILKGRLPNLRSLMWILHRSDASRNSNTEHDVFDAFEHLPSLVDLAMHPHTSQLHSVVQLPWSQIDNYSGIRLRLSSQFYHLLNMTNLTSLYLVDANHLDGVPPITLPSLTSLSVVSRPSSGSTTDKVDPLLDLLVLPKLEVLRISVDLPVASLPEFVTRSAPTLRAIWLNITGMSDDALTEVLEIVPVLTSLSIQHPTNHLIRALAASSSKGKLRLLPRLRELRLFSGDVIDDMESFATMVALRTQEGSGSIPSSGRRLHEPRHLQRLCFDDNFPVGDDDLRELRASGLEVELLTPHWSRTPFP
ncbi:hypothetical protein V5O48_012104, partial [Marasmius crinis-equi]